MEWSAGFGGEDGDDALWLGIGGLLADEEIGGWAFEGIELQGAEF